MPAPKRIPGGLLDAVVQSAFVVTAVLTRVGAAHDLSLTQLRVLGILRDRRPGVGALAEHLGLEKSTMSGLVDRAERRGLVRRTRSTSDARAVEVSLTPAGERLAAEVFREIHAALDPLLGALDASGQSQLERFLRTVLAPTEPSQPPT